MLRKLRTRPRADDLVDQQSRSTNRTARLVYLTLLAVLGVSLINYLFGDLIFLRADGLVLRDKTSIAATYIARVETVHVKSGQQIKENDLVIRLQSTQMLERLADLSAQRAALATKLADFRIRSEIVSNLLPLAQRRERQTTIILQQFDKLSGRQLVTGVRHDEALRARYDAHRSLVKLQAERRTLDEELQALDVAWASADAALAKLRNHYADGVVRSAVAGAVGVSVPSEGDVYRPGETILSLYSKQAYVLAYLPSRYLFPIDTGMRVQVTSGRRSATGVVEKILPVTDALPKEFQNTFRPRDRGQLARIRLPANAAFPLHDKVRLSKNFFGFVRLAYSEGSRE